MPEEKKKTVQRALLEEVQEIHDMLEVIEKRSKYLKPPSIKKAATRSLLLGMAQGLGVFIGGTIIVALLVFGFTRLVQSGAIQDFLGKQIEQSIDKAISDRAPSIPGFGN